MDAINTFVESLPRLRASTAVILSAIACSEKHNDYADRARMAILTLNHVGWSIERIGRLIDVIESDEITQLYVTEGVESAAPAAMAKEQDAFNLKLTKAFIDDIVGHMHQDGFTRTHNKVECASEVSVRFRKKIAEAQSLAPLLDIFNANFYSTLNPFKVAR